MDGAAGKSDGGKMTVGEIALAAKGVWKVFGPRAGAFEAMTDRSPEAMQRAGWVGAVQDASFDIARGEVFVIMGLSGSGKSTLLRCLTRLIEPTAGAVIMNGIDLCTAGPDALRDMRRAQMGMVFQHFALLPNRSVLGNIAFPLQVQGMARPQAHKRAQELIDIVGLTGREDRFPSELSGGQQQRIGIARSLATDPAFWFLDEPFSALDPLIRSDLQDEVLRLQRQLAKTVVFVTHDLDEAIKLADRICIMESGRIVQIGTPEMLVTQPATDYVRRFVAKVPLARVVRVASVMEPLGAGDMPDGQAVRGSDTIREIAGVVVEGPERLPVTGADGALVGFLDRQRALRVLALGG